MPNPFVLKLQGMSDLTPEAVIAIERATSLPRKFAIRSHLIREGDRPGPVFVMIDGWAYRYKILSAGTRQIMAFMMPGDACDLHAGMLAEMDHGIQAASTSRVAIIQRSEMDQMMYDHPSIARAMYIAQLVDEGTLRAWIVSMGRRSSIASIAHLMCELYLRAKWTGATVDGEFEVPFTQIILADALGMTSVHINRMLRELRESGAMSLRRGSVVISDPAKLACIAGFDENYLHRQKRRQL